MTPDELTSEFQKAYAEMKAFHRELAVGRILKAVSAAAMSGITLDRTHHYFISHVTDYAARNWPQAMFGHKDAKVMEPAVFNHHYSKWLRFGGELSQRLGQYLMNEIPQVQDASVFHADDPVTAANLFSDRYVRDDGHDEDVLITAYYAIEIAAQPWCCGHWVLRSSADVEYPVRLFSTKIEALEVAKSLADKCGVTAYLQPVGRL